MGPLERFKNAEALPFAMKGQVDIMFRNANALLKLVNQLLDFRKLETGGLKPELRRGDLTLFVRGIVESFSSLADEKGIHLKFSAVNDSMVTHFDPDKIEKIMNNLLSNRHDS
jgi:signal transduction histidine kinase